MACHPVLVPGLNKIIEQLINSNRSQEIVAGFARFQGGFSTPTARKKAALDSLARLQGGFEKIPAITDFRAEALSWARRA